VKGIAVSQGLFAQLIAVTTGLMLLTAVAQMWRRSLAVSIRLLAVQGAGLAGLVAVLGVDAGDAELVGAATLVLAVKGIGLPWALTRTIAATGVTRAQRSLINPTAGVLAAAGLTTLAYAVSQPMLALSIGRAGRALPVGMALVLIGFLVLVSYRTALAQLIGFVVLDNGIAAVAFLTAGGLPLVVELGVTLDVLLVVMILRVLAGRMVLAYGGTDLDDLRELRD
jgi:hydrogenase-4 component E